MSETKNFLEMMGASLEQGLEALSRLDARARKDRDNRICACGHSVKAHEMTPSGRMVGCKPSKMECPCLELKPVVRTGNVRYFVRKTMGPGYDHALMLGLMKCARDGVEVEWLIEPKCEFCDSTVFRPIPFSRTGQVVSGPGAYTKLLCEQHYGIATAALGSEE